MAAVSLSREAGAFIRMPGAAMPQSPSFMPMAMLSRSRPWPKMTLSLVSASFDSDGGAARASSRVTAPGAASCGARSRGRALREG